MTDATTQTADRGDAGRAARRTHGRTHPGLEGVVGAESAIGLVDGKNGRLLYRGYPIGQLVDRGHVRRGRRPALDRRVASRRRSSTRPRCPSAVLVALRALPDDAHPMDALRTAVSVWGATQKIAWPPTPEQARALTAFSPSALAAFDRLRRGLEPVDAGPRASTSPAASSSS